MPRAAIIVAPYFPPSSLAGVHRARHLAKHLPASGWTPIVVTVDEAFHEQRLDLGLAALAPSSVEVVKVPALPLKFGRPVGLGDISLRAWPQLRGAVIKLLASRAVGAVLITGSPYYPMLFAAEIKKRFGVPVVLDFQDPWVSAWGAEQALWSKAGISHLLSVALEPRAVRAADFITSVSETQNNQLAARYPWLDHSRMAAIPIGGDQEDYSALRDGTGILEIGRRPPDACFHIVYVGTIWPPVIGTLRIVLRAVRLLREQAPEVYGRLRVHFIGTTADPNDKEGYCVLPLAKAEGVAEIVQEIPQRLPYLEALSFQANADAILALGSNEPHYTASKIFGILMSGRPYLSVFHARSSSHEILSAAGGGVSLAFETNEELAGLSNELSAALVRIVTDPNALGRADPAAYAPYTAGATAAKFAAIFDRVAAKKKTAA